MKLLDLSHQVIQSSIKSEKINPNPYSHSTSKFLFYEEW